MQKGVDYIGVGCGAVIRNIHGEILFGLRSGNVRNEIGYWTIPGGSVEFGEKRCDAVVREVQEEIGCRVEVVREIGTFDHFISTGNLHWISTIFLCRIVEGGGAEYGTRKMRKTPMVFIRGSEEVTSFSSSATSFSGFGERGLSPQISFITQYYTTSAFIRRVDSCLRRNDNGTLTRQTG